MNGTTNDAVVVLLMLGYLLCIGVLLLNSRKGE